MATFDCYGRQRLGKRATLDCRHCDARYLQTLLRLERAVLLGRDLEMMVGGQIEETEDGHQW